MVRPKIKKLHPRTNKLFLGLIKKYKIYDFGPSRKEITTTQQSTTFLFFKKHYLLLNRIFYVFSMSQAWSFIKLRNYALLFDGFNYYALLSRDLHRRNLSLFRLSTLNTHLNIIVFSRPAKQLYFVIFKAKPVFIFTGGLMRIVMREPRKSSKKLYKVATSLIKLFNILLFKRGFFPPGYLKLINVGNLRPKILNSVLKRKMISNIIGVIILFKIDFTSQKLETRRAIKKYVKKRFKIR